MKKLFLLFIFLSSNIFAQDSTLIVKTKYTELDKMEISFSSLFGSNQKSVEFKLIELINLTSQDTLSGVEITIETNENEITSGSIGLLSLGSIWGSSSQLTFKNIQDRGYIFLSLNDLQEVINFFNQAVQETIKVDDKRFRVLKLTLYDKFEFGLIHNKGWEYLISVDGIAYGLDYNQGIEVIKKLNSYKKAIEGMK